METDHSSWGTTWHQLRLQHQRALQQPSEAGHRYAWSTTATTSGWGGHRATSGCSTSNLTTASSRNCSTARSRDTVNTTTTRSTSTTSSTTTSTTYGETASSTASSTTTSRTTSKGTSSSSTCTSSKTSSSKKHYNHCRGPPPKAANSIDIPHDDAHRVVLGPDLVHIPVESGILQIATNIDEKEQQLQEDLIKQTIELQDFYEDWGEEHLRWGGHRQLDNSTTTSSHQDKMGHRTSTIIYLCWWHRHSSWFLEGKVCCQGIQPAHQ